MASPLLPKAREVNASVTSGNLHLNGPKGLDATHDMALSESEDLPSSPFVANITDPSNIENVSPVKVPVRPSSPTLSKGPSPLKPFKSTERLQSSNGISLSNRSPRKLSSPEKRFPVKVSVSPEKRPETQQVPFTTVYAQNVTNTIKIFEDGQSILDNDGDDICEEDTVLTFSDEKISEDDGDGFADETAFSTFSAVPDMTMFAKIGHSTAKSRHIQETPTQNGLSRPHLPSALDAPDSESPTPRRQRETGNTTDLIVDFTEQFNGISDHTNAAPTRQTRSPSRSRPVPELLAHMQRARTPSPTKFRQQLPSTNSKFSNLIDFDIPPAPTPRSMPSITPRELETLKSAFLSEISSLKASLSGKEAEIHSLKTAVGDAEKRVGECMEKVREEQNLKEQLAIEKDEWARRGREMEQVLRNVKEEIVRGERDRESLEGKFEESEKRREAAEIMAQEAESKLAGMRASSSLVSERGEDDKKSQPASTAKSVEIAVEKVAKELHTLYKSKHENKVAALKKSYEARWDRRIKELESQLESLVKENEDLKLGRDATMSGVVPKLPNDDSTADLRLQASLDTQHTRELEARVVGLSEEIKSVKMDNAELRSQLEQERIEKGELVAACDELLALQDLVPPSHPAVSSGVENLRGSISRASGLRAPNFSSGTGNMLQTTESRIGRTEKSKSGSTQVNRPGSGLGLRSGIMSSIEKMGSHKGRVE